MKSEQVPNEKLGYGTLGMNVGTVGHWARLIFGSMLLLFVIANLVPRLTTGSYSIIWLGQFLGYIATITILYAVVYWFLGNQGILQRLSAWANTILFVGPAFFVAWWGFLIAPFTGISLPSAFWLAMLAYIGLSFVIQWRLNYGGCEVVSLPILFFGKRYPTYCIPLVALDAVEKAIIDSQVEKPVQETD